MKNLPLISCPNCVKRLKHVNGEIQAAQQAYDLNKAAELQYGKLPELQKQLAEEEEKVKESGSQSGT